MTGRPHLAWAHEGRTAGWSGLRDLIGRYRGTILLLAVASLVGALLEAAFVVCVTTLALALVGSTAQVGPLLGIVLDRTTAMIAAAGLLSGSVIANVVAVNISASLTAAVTTDQRQRLAHAYLAASWAVQQDEPTGRLQELLTSFVGRASSAVATLTHAVAALLGLVAFLCTGIAVNVSAATLVVAGLALVGLLLTPMRRRIRSISRDASAKNLAFANAVSEISSLGMETKTFGVVPAVSARLDQLTSETTSTQRHVQILTQLVPTAYAGLAYAAALGGLALATQLGLGDLNVIGSVLVLMLRSLSYGQQLASATGSLVASAPYLAKIDETVDGYLKAPSPVGRNTPSTVTPIVVRDVDYAYSTDRQAITGANFAISRGEIIGVVGPSGAGKSTMAQLLLGLREPDSGEILVNDINLKDVDRSWWNRRTAFVAQEPRLITGSVADNIRFLREQLSDEELMRAATQANIIHDIQALPQGLDTHLGDRGYQLSGGQRQRISIARALAGQPEFLVLDEPTSALDGRSEGLIRETLEQLRGSKTVLIIAHRLSTLDICDRIIVIEGGRVTGVDTDANLRLSNAFYRSALVVAGMLAEP